jgi:ParB family chromosome partitioning protein
MTLRIEVEPHSLGNLVMRRALGRGLSQLLAEKPEQGVLEVEIGRIVPNAEQPRQRFESESLAELADSIREVGILQPLIVRPLPEGKFELVAGERRLRAAKVAGLSKVPVVTRSVGQQSSLELALIENLQREDITPLECARAYRRLIDDFDMSQEQVAARVGKSRSAVANTVRLLRLPRRAQEALESGAISEGHARALLAFDSEALQLALLDKALRLGLTVRDLELEGRKKPEKKVSGPKRRGRVDPETTALQTAVSERLGAPAKILRTGDAGRIVIEFYSNQDLERILDAMGIEV